VRATPRGPGRTAVEFTVTARLDTPQDAVYYAHGGILPYVYRRFLDGGLG
jgi:aconitate hydratase